jgi:hypothetical protein
VADFEFSGGVGTVEAWFRADWTGIGYNPCMLANRDGGPVNWSIHMTADKAAAGVWNGATYQVAALPAVGKAWHHFVLAFEVGQWSLYIDGQLAGTQTQGMGMTAALPTQIGSSSAAATAEGWLGTFDEVAFYGDTLDAETVEAHYKAMLEGGSTRTPFHRGDANADGAINITDGIYILNYLFLGGPSPPCKEAANPNNDVSINITDGIYVLNFLFLGGPPPAAPGPMGSPCGTDPDPEGSAGDLGCNSYTKC